MGAGSARMMHTPVHTRDMSETSPRELSGKEVASVLHWDLSRMALSTTKDLADVVRLGG